MAKGPRYRVQLRRRREGKTDYYARRELLKSGKTRVVIRRSTKHMRVQFIEALPNGDKTLSDSISSQLNKFGWPITGGNIPAAYLTGYLAGKRALKAGVSEGILDLGLQTNQKGSRIYAALKGVTDAGITIPVNDVIYPGEEVINGSHIVNSSASYKEEDAKLYKKVFAKYEKQKVKPDGLDKLVKKVKKAIDAEY